MPHPVDSGAQCWLGLAAAEGCTGAAAAAMAAERKFSLDRSDEDDGGAAAGEEQEGAAGAHRKVDGSGGLERLQIAGQLEFHLQVLSVTATPV